MTDGVLRHQLPDGRFVFGSIVSWGHFAGLGWLDDDGSGAVFASALFHDPQWYDPRNEHPDVILEGVEHHERSAPEA